MNHCGLSGKCLVVIKIANKCPRCGENIVKTVYGVWKCPFCGHPKVKHTLGSGNQRSNSAKKKSSGFRQSISPVIGQIVANQWNESQRDVLFSLLDDPDQNVRIQAIQTIIKYGRQDSIDTLLERYGRIQHVCEKKALINSLLKMNDTEIERRILQQIALDLANANQSSKIFSIARLKRIPNKESLALLHPLANDPDAEVRRLAENAITQLNNSFVK